MKTQWMESQKLARRLGLDPHTGPLDVMAASTGGEKIDGWAIEYRERIACSTIVPEYRARRPDVPEDLQTKNRPSETIAEAAQKPDNEQPGGDDVGASSDTMISRLVSKIKRIWTGRQK